LRIVYDGPEGICRGSRGCAVYCTLYAEAESCVFGENYISDITQLLSVFLHNLHR